MSTYEITYTFEGHYSGTPTEVLERSFETLANQQAEGIDIEHLGGTVTLGADGAVSEGTARYAAPTEGHVGWLAVHASLPISGIRRIEPPRQTPDGPRDES
ncbi:MAG: hypothetical protein KGY43_07275 [Halodesulfurarchaeum sp.]|nr:hypothetical protein [Halodesulfurarchaeum sp.]